MKEKKFSGFERRRFARLATRCIIAIEEADMRDGLGLADSESRRTKGQTINISAGGVLFEVDRKYDVGAILHLKIKMPDWQKYCICCSHSKRVKPKCQSFNALVKVVRVEEVKEGKVFDIGVSFLSLDSIQKEAMVKYIDSNLE